MNTQQLDEWMRDITDLARSVGWHDPEVRRQLAALHRAEQHETFAQPARLAAVGRVQDGNLIVLGAVKYKEQS